MLLKSNIKEMIEWLNVDFVFGRIFSLGMSRGTAAIGFVGGGLVTDMNMKQVNLCISTTADQLYFQQIHRKTSYCV
jgi:hypothetical protein